MKGAAQTKKQPAKATTKASRPATPTRRAEKPTAKVQGATPPAVPANGNTTTPMPDLKPFGVDLGAAQAHVVQCEQCGRAYRHVMKNPKDAMALDSFGRHVAVCLARKPSTAPA